MTEQKQQFRPRRFFNLIPLLLTVLLVILGVSVNRYTNREYKEALENAKAMTNQQDYLGAIDEANRLIDAVLVPDEYLNEAYQIVGLAEMAQSLYFDSEVTFNEALSHDPGNPEFHFFRGVARLNQEKIEMARADFAAVLESYDSEEALRNKATEALLSLED